MRSTLAMLAFTTTLLAAHSAQAHGDIHLAGTLVKIDARSIDVRTPQGGLHVVATSAGTRVVVQERPAKIADLKVGQSVEVLGYGDTADNMLARGVRVVAASAQAR